MQNNETTHCRVCKEIISSSAVKCRHCGSFQNWRRYLGLSSSFLSVAVAFISVLTVFTSIALDSIKENDSNIEISIINKQRTYFSDMGRGRQVLLVDVFVTNAGRRPGTIKSFAVKGEGDNEFIYMKSGPPQSGGPYLHKPLEVHMIEPNKSIMLKQHLKTSLDADTFETKYSNADFKAEIINFSGKKNSIIKASHNSLPLYY